MNPFLDLNFGNCTQTSTLKCSENARLLLAIAVISNYNMEIGRWTGQVLDLWMDQ